MTAYLTLKRDPPSSAQDGSTITIAATQVRNEAEDDPQGQSGVAVHAGEQLTKRQLLDALLIPPGNNLSRILVARVAGSEISFVDAMNAEARAVGMDHTTDTDPSGFDPGTVSTAADQLRVLEQTTWFPLFRQTVSTPRVTLLVGGTPTHDNPLIADGYARETGSGSAGRGVPGLLHPGDVRPPSHE
jgi:D-alanyl-D-alanine carboxypeptidase (penicillin-binding protein 5/6)